MTRALSRLWRWWTGEPQPEAIHARREGIRQEQAHRSDEPLPADRGCMARMNAGPIDARQPIPSGWRW